MLRVFVPSTVPVRLIDRPLTSPGLLYFSYRLHDVVIALRGVTDRMHRMNGFVCVSGERRRNSDTLHPLAFEHNNDVVTGDGALTH